MTARIKLSKDTLSVISFNEYQINVNCMGETGCPRFTEEQTKQLKQQILSDYKKVPRLETKIKQLKEKIKKLKSNNGNKK